MAWSVERVLRHPVDRSLYRVVLAEKDAGGAITQTEEIDLRREAGETATQFKARAKAIVGERLAALNSPAWEDVTATLGL